MAYKAGVMLLIISGLLAGCSDKSSKNNSQSSAGVSANSSNSSAAAARALEAAGLIRASAKLPRPPGTLSDHNG